MVMKRKKILEVINELPEEFNVDDFIERLILISKLEAGLEQDKAGQTLPLEKVVKQFRKKWRK